jgi:Holliday junction resolvase RusA-like endonuclease
VTACVKCGFDPDASVRASWTFFVDRDAPSLNARIFNAGPRRWKYKRERDAWCWEIRAVALMRKMRTAGAGKRRVTLTRVYGGQQKPRDPDNLVGGMKSIVDALVLERLIVDDSAAFAEIHYAEERGEPRGVRFHIEEIG